MLGKRMEHIYRFKSMTTHTSNGFLLILSHFTRLDSNTFRCICTFFILNVCLKPSAAMGSDISPLRINARGAAETHNAATEMSTARFISLNLRFAAALESALYAVKCSYSDTNLEL